MWEKIGLGKTAFGKKTVWDKQILEQKSILGEEKTYFGKKMFWENRFEKKQFRENRFGKKSVLEKPILENISFGKTDLVKTDLGEKTI